MLPRRRTRLAKVRIERRLYRQRQEVECFFYSLKRWRKVARRDKNRGITLLSMGWIAAIEIFRF